MKREIIPDGYVTPEVKAYIERMLDDIEAAILTAQAVFVTRTIPDRAIAGLLYYVAEDLLKTDGSLLAEKGYWTWFPDETLDAQGYYEKVVLGSELNALEDRVAALEAP